MLTRFSCGCAACSTPPRLSFPRHLLLILCPPLLLDSTTHIHTALTGFLLKFHQFLPGKESKRRAFQSFLDSNQLRSISHGIEMDFGKSNFELTSWNLSRPSPASALAPRKPASAPLLSDPTLRANPRKRKRKTQNTAYSDEHPTSKPWEPLGESKREFHHKSMWESKQNVMSSRLNSNQEPWIRLLKLRPRRLIMQPMYELITVRTEDHPPYKAISYAWGDPVNTEIVWVIQDDRQGWLKIPINLSHALHVLQHNTEDIFVWADSICINQKDNRDKTQQLSRIPDIYGMAEQVILWLGVEKDDSIQAHKILHGLTHSELQLSHDTDLTSIVSLFDRDYWSRLWVVQEILHAKNIVVQCGISRLSWNDYTSASRLFQSERDTLAKIPTLVHGSSDFTRLITSQHRLSSLQILVHHGPASISHIQNARELYSDDPENSYIYFLHLLRVSRTKLASDPKDRVYGILGILPDKIRAELRVNYLLPVREIYVDVVEILFRSGNLDVICESIHFPPQISNTNFPSWVPDWSYDPMVRSLASLPLSFSASKGKTPSFSFHEERFGSRTRSKLLIAGVRIGTIKSHGMAVNTHSRAADYCMAFLQWRALLLQHFDIPLGSSLAEDDEETRRFRVVSCQQQCRFCLTLSLGHPTRTNSSDANTGSKGMKNDLGMEWAKKCYCVFAKIIRARLPALPIDEDLMAFAEMDDDMEPKTARQFLQDSFAKNMMGRCFCITDSGCLGLGSGAMAQGDVVVVPYGCSTPVLLRPERSSLGTRNWLRPQEYRFVGDAYIHGYMDGEAVEQGTREEFLLH